MKRKTNEFGSYLEELLLTSNIKNSLLAKALQYDISYISKWISGVSLPSKKSIDNICHTASIFIIDNSCQSGIEKMCNAHGTTDLSHLKTELEVSLRDAFFRSTGEKTPSMYTNNSSFHLNPSLDIALMTDYESLINFSEGADIIVLADLFAFDNHFKLFLCGIRDGKFAVTKLRDDIHLQFIINFSNLQGKNIYDVVLLIHMLTNYSRIDFTLFQNDFASNKLIFSVKNTYASASITSENIFLSSTSVRDKVLVDSLFYELEKFGNSEKRVFIPSTVTSMLYRHEYLQSLISQKIRWLVGHITEQFLSPDLSLKTCQRVFAENPELSDECLKASSLSSKLLKSGEISIMLYESALTNFVLSGEVDFFNRKIILTPDERKTQLIYLLDVITRNEKFQMRFINGGFSSDFRYITNPCLFLSDSITYLRLENNYYENNILISPGKHMCDVFDDFFDEIWTNREDVVISNRSEVTDKLHQFIDATASLSVVE